MRTNLSAEERANVDSWPLGGTQLIAYGDVRVIPENLLPNTHIQTVNGGWVVAGGDITPEGVYTQVSNVTGRLVFRPESKLAFGYPNTSGTVDTPLELQQDDSDGVAVLKFQALDENGNTDLDRHLWYVSPFRVANVQTPARLAMTHKAGLVVFDEDELKYYGSNGTDWIALEAGAGGGMADPGSNGIVVRTALNVTVARSIVTQVSAGNEGILITTGDGVAGNVQVGLEIVNLATVTPALGHFVPYRGTSNNRKISFQEIFDLSSTVLGATPTTSNTVLGFQSGIAKTFTVSDLLALSHPQIMRRNVFNGAF
jgi:hypothetical protein